MFGFGKKKRNEPKKEVIKEVFLTEERKEELLRTISVKSEAVHHATGEEQAKIYDTRRIELHSSWLPMREISLPMTVRIVQVYQP